MEAKKMDELFQAPAQITKLETMSDGGVRVVIDTQEIEDPEEMSKLFRLRKGAVGHFLFKSNRIKAEDIPEGDVVEGEAKTPSQRLRAVMFVYWKECKGGSGDFNDWYRRAMEQIIEAYKDKLPPKGAD